MFTVFFSLYELIGNPSFLNRQGALLSFNFADGSVGYADCHPWHELGDEPLPKQLSLLALHKTTPLTAQSLHFAQMDAIARRIGCNLFSNVQIPPSHWFGHIHDLAFPKEFSRIKIKVGDNPQKEIPQLIRIAKQLPGHAKLRLDFNHKLTLQEFESYLYYLGDAIHQIDFIEDPFPFDKKNWVRVQDKYGITLAVDRGSDKYLKEAPANSIIVMKPAIQAESHFTKETLKGRRIMVTSYLDHPYGQLTAAYVAAKIKMSMPDQLEICGLPLRPYQTNSFSERVAIKGDVLIPPNEGTGFGFDDLLEKQKWILAQ